MKISKGKKNTAVRVVLYGVEGIGKSTLVSHFPEPLYIDTESGTMQLDVERFDGITTWKDITDAIDYVISNSTICKTLVVDTADRAEQMLITYLLERDDKASIEDYGFGKGYTMVQETFQKDLLNRLDKVIALGINTAVVAHSIVKTINTPEGDSYDHYELKCSRKVSPILKEWADMLLFANYKITVIEDQNGKGKAKGTGKRMLYTSHKPTYDAKNRFGLPDELPLEYSSIKSVIEGATPKKESKVLDIASKVEGVIDEDNPVEESSWSVLVREAENYELTEEEVIEYLSTSGYGDEPEQYSNSLISNLRENMAKLAKTIKENN